MFRSGYFICFTGMDGTGKTTLSRIIVEDLNNKGMKFKYVYARFIPVLSRPLITLGGLIIIRKGNLFENYSEYTNKKRNEIEKHKFLSKLYQTIILIDYLIQLSYKIKIPLFFGQNIICDRYIYDTIISDLSVDMDYSNDGSIKLLDKLHHIIPKPNITFLMDISEKIAYSRKDDLPSIKYLQERRSRYLRIGVCSNMIILDGAKRLDELKNLIVTKVLNELMLDG